MNILLLIISVLIYAYLGVKSLVFIVLSILTSFFSARFIEKSKHKKIWLWGTIALNTGILVAFRILSYNKVSNIIVPIGISYYTLQVISYLVDVYKNKYKAETNFIYYALYILYIPHLYIGPISKYDDMKKEIVKHKKITLNNFYEGFLRIVWGLAKKLIIATRIQVVISSITTNEFTGVFALIAMLLYSIELYADFSGGIDVVLGISKILDINLVENFDSPYYSETIKEFWRRWHISLSKWLKDYIYIPLGGNRKGKFRKSINVLVTFLVSGIWHGFNYIIWGIFHGIFVLFGDKFKTKNKWINRIITYLIVSILWSFFIWNNSIQALQMIGTVFTKFSISSLVTNFTKLGLENADWIVLLISTIVLAVFDGNKEKIKTKISNSPAEVKTLLLCTLIIIVIVLGMYGIGFNVSEFIYSKF